MRKFYESARSLNLQCKVPFVENLDLATSVDSYTGGFCKPCYNKISNVLHFIGFLGL